MSAGILVTATATPTTTKRISKKKQETRKNSKHVRTHKCKGSLHQMRHIRIDEFQPSNDNKTTTESSAAHVLLYKPKQLTTLAS
jgi:hypothetical protein